MSEYQFVAFRAVDRALTDRELAYAERQSTRAQITRWSFENEYHFGDFHGNVAGLLCHGYDIHLHYANYGVRKIALRLSAGLPFPKSVWSKYIGIGEFRWKKDTKGKGGILTLNPYHESGEIEEIWDPGVYMDEVVEIRNRLVEGDLRVLYLLWLCAALDNDSVSPDVIEPPVPRGLAECVECYGPLLEFFGLDPLILSAASAGAPTSPARKDHTQRCATWVDGLSASEAKRLLHELLVEDYASVKAQINSAIRVSEVASVWPTVALGRSFRELLDQTNAFRSAHDAKQQRKTESAARRKAAKQERERKHRMTEMVKDPTKWLRKTENLVHARGIDNYQAAADILADLRDAVGGDEGAQITRKHATHLAKKHPTLNRLKSSLRKRGLLE